MQAYLHTAILLAPFLLRKAMTVEASGDWAMLCVKAGAALAQPPSLKQQALADFDWLIGRTLGRPEADERSERIRRALEALPND